MIQCCSGSTTNVKKASSVNSDIGSAVDSKSSNNKNKHANNSSTGKVNADGVPTSRCCGLISAVAHTDPHGSIRRSTLRMSDTPQFGSAVVYFQRVLSYMYSSEFCEACE
jgi:hypothetical protein